MIRSAVPTLGLIVALGGVSAALGDDLSLAEWPLLSPAVPAVTGVFPRLAENWSDLPLQLHVQETVGYNSNIANSPTGPGASADLYGRPIGALESISTYGVEFKNEVSGQQFFADAYWGMNRYLNNGFFNTAHHNEDIGDNFTYGSKCAGTLKASQVTAPSLPGQQIGFNVINTTSTVSLSENAKCIVTGEYAAIFNSGTSTSTNSAELDQANNFQSVFVAAGISYTVSDTNSLELLATVTGTDYTDRQLVSGEQGLLNKLTTDQVMATYIKNFSPTLALNAQIGIIGVSDEYFSFGIPHTILPQYSFSVQWTATPKLAFTAVVSRFAAPPTSIISNLQATDSATASVTYHYTPKVLLSANLEASYSTGAAGAVSSNLLLAPFTQSQRTYGAGAKLTYTLTPFLAADLSYQYTRSIQSS